ncbi:MAG: hypothetical protein ACM31C_08680 [Acidobacteriota bacterium]
MLRLAFASVVLLAATTAHAERPDAEDPPPPPSPASTLADGPAYYVGGGAMLGIGSWIESAVVVDAGVRMPGRAGWLHGQFASGGGGDFEGTGPLYRGLVGVENRCTGSDTCAIAGADVGYELLTWNGDPGDMAEHHHGLVVAGRLGVDAGGDHVRFRAAFEVSMFHDHSEMTSASWGPDVAVSIGLAYRP